MRLVITSLMAGVLLVALHATASGATGPLPGDYNGDGEVDHLDFVEWKAGFGAGVDDFNAADYTTWRDNVGRSQSVNPIPEPATLALVTLGGAALLGLARRRR